jgi:Sulfotransferase domain
VDVSVSFPDFFVLGAPKAGTTALCEFLMGHPGICLSKPKESHYFTRNYRKGKDWYQTECYDRLTGQLCGEGTPTYLGLSHALHRIADEAPRAKLFVLLRDPALRAFSAWWMAVSLGRERLGFEAALRVCLKQPNLNELFSSDPDLIYREMKAHRQVGEPYYRGYLHYGQYGPQMAELRTLFGPEQIHVIWSQDLRQDTAREVSRALQFLGLDPSLRKGDLKPRWQAFGVRTAILRAYLKERISPRLVEGGAFRAFSTVMRRLGDLPVQPGEHARRFLLDHFRLSDEILEEQIGCKPPWRGEP